MGLPYSLDEIIRRAIESRLTDLWTALPGIVKAFDPATCTCDVQLALRRLVPDGETDGETDVPEELPIIPNVPVMYSQGAACVVRFPLTVGDPVLLLFLTLSATQWRLTGEVPSTPGDPRNHALGSAVALAGFVPDVNVSPLTVTDGLEITAPLGPIAISANTAVTIAAPTVTVTAPNVASVASTEFRVTSPKVRTIGTSVRLGIDSEADTLDKFVALADKVATELSAISTAIGTPVVVPAGGGPVSFTYTPGSVAAARVKAR